jgi:hypothetical protein
MVQLSDYSTCAIGITNYNSSNNNEAEFRSYQKHLFENWNPVLVRAPNHFNTGNSQIINNCYFYVTYECEVEVSQHQFTPSVSMCRPLTWEPIETRLITYNKLNANAYNLWTDAGKPNIGALSYQSNLRAKYNFNPSAAADNPDFNRYQLTCINDEVTDVVQGTEPLRHIDPQIINITQADNQVVHKLQSNGERALQI